MRRVGRRVAAAVATAWDVMARLGFLRRNLGSRPALAALATISWAALSRSCCAIWHNGWACLPFPAAWRDGWSMRRIRRLRNSSEARAELEAALQPNTSALWAHASKRCSWRHRPPSTIGNLSLRWITEAEALLGLALYVKRLAITGDGLPVQGDNCTKFGRLQASRANFKAQQAFCESAPRPGQNLSKWRGVSRAYSREGLKERGSRIKEALPWLPSGPRLPSRAS